MFELAVALSLWTTLSLAFASLAADRGRWRAFLRNHAVPPWSRDAAFLLLLPTLALALSGSPALNLLLGD